MAGKYEQLTADVQERFGDEVEVRLSSVGEVTCEVAADRLIETCQALRDEEPFGFEQLIDLCGVDYLEYGHVEWKTESTTATGFSRGVEREAEGGEDAPADERPPGRRFAVVYHVLSVRTNRRLRVRTYCQSDDYPRVESMIGVWPAANWFEREAFDLYGILFDGHPDLRRLLTDYGFIGHPFRKDFPLSGNVEVRYDPQTGRVVYQPVSIEPRTLVPRVIRSDNRYRPALKEPSPGG